MYGLAEMLGKTIGELNEVMGFEEFCGWMVYFEMKNRPPEDKNNLMAGGEDAILKGFGF